MHVYVNAPNYVHRIGGIVAMHYLMYLMLRNGHEVHTSTRIFNPEYELIPDTRLFIGKIDQITIVPEISFIDKSITSPVLRWVLYYPGVLAGPKHYGELEEVYHWGPAYEESAAQASFHKRSTEFSLPSLKKEDYVFEEQERAGDLVVVHKGKNVLTHPLDAFEITSKNPKNRMELLQLLRSRNTLYSYDKCTRLVNEAKLSGMSVKLWNYNDKIWEDYILDKKYEVFVDYENDAKRVAWLLEDFQNKFRKLFEVNYQAKTESQS